MRRNKKIIVALLVVGGVAAAFVVLPIRLWLVSLVAWIQHAGMLGVAVFSVIYVVATVAMLPGSLLTLAAGFAWGPLWGLVLVSPVSVLAATIAFILGRTILRGWVKKRVAADRRFAAIDRAVGQHGFKIVFLLRLSPVVPFSLLNVALGLTTVRLGHYVVASFLGMLPATALYVYAGSLITKVSQLLSDSRPVGAGPWQQVMYFAGLAATIAVTLLITRVARRALDDVIDDCGDIDAGLQPGHRRSRLRTESSRRDHHHSRAQLEEDAMTPARQPFDPVSVSTVHPAAEANSLILPDDAHNRALVEQVRPRRWVNPTPTGRYNLVVIGAGTAGLVAAAGAAGLGAKVALVERHLMGGDCLNYGCVPSKGLLAAAHKSYDLHQGRSFGVNVPANVHVDFGRVMARVRRERAALAKNDSADRFRGLGVDVYLGEGRFTSPTTVEVAGQRLDFRRALIATGARAAPLPASGIEEADVLTNETLFSLTDLPRRLVVIGAGPIGCEMAQAFRRLGSEVTIVAKDERLLPREDEAAAEILRQQFEYEGIHLALGSSIERVERRGEDRKVVFRRNGQLERASGDQVLVAVGRRANLDGLGLDAAAVRAHDRGVVVNDRLQTTNRRVYAAGDVASSYQFTHAADAMARIVIQNALFFGRKKASGLVIPWATYTDPEVAHVGLSKDDAAARGIEVGRVHVPLAEVDRARLEAETNGFVEVLYDRRRNGRIVGGTIVGRHAGEMVGELSLAMTAGLTLGDLSASIHPYPTRTEVLKRAGDAYARTRLTPRVSRLFAWWMRLWR